MAVLRLKNGMEKFSDAKLVSTVKFIVTSMTNNPNFPNPRPSLANVSALVEDFSKAVNGALSGDRDKINAKNEKRETLIDTMHLLSYYVLFESEGSKARAQSSGFEVAGGRSAREVSKPTNLKVVNTDQTSQLLVSVSNDRAAMAYLIQYSTDTELKEDNWITVASTSRKCLLDGLQPGTLYYIRVAAVGAREQIMYSDVVSKIVA